MISAPSRTRLAISLDSTTWSRTTSSSSPESTSITLTRRLSDLGTGMLPRKAFPASKQAKAAKSWTRTRRRRCLGELRERLRKFAAAGRKSLEMARVQETSFLGEGGAGASSLISPRRQWSVGETMSMMVRTSFLSSVREVRRAKVKRFQPLISSTFTSLAANTRSSSFLETYLKLSSILGVSLTVTCMNSSLLRSMSRGITAFNSFTVSCLILRLLPPTKALLQTKSVYRGWLMMWVWGRSQSARKLQRCCMGAPRQWKLSPQPRLEQEWQGSPSRSCLTGILLVQWRSWSYTSTNTRSPLKRGPKCPAHFSRHLAISTTLTAQGLLPTSCCRTVTSSECTCGCCVVFRWSKKLCDPLCHTTFPSLSTCSTIFWVRERYEGTVEDGRRPHDFSHELQSHCFALAQRREVEGGRAFCLFEGGGSPVALLIPLVWLCGLPLVDGDDLRLDTLVERQFVEVEQPPVALSSTLVGEPWREQSDAQLVLVLQDLVCGHVGGVHAAAECVPAEAVAAEVDPARVGCLELEGGLEESFVPPVVGEDAVGECVKVVVVGAEAVLIADLAVILRDAVVPEHHRPSHPLVHLRSQESQPLLEHRHRPNTRLDVDQVPVKADAASEGDKEESKLSRAECVLEEAGTLDDEGAETFGGSAAAGEPPVPGRHGDVVVREVHERLRLLQLQAAVRHNLRLLLPRQVVLEARVLHVPAPHVVAQQQPTLLLLGTHVRRKTPNHRLNAGD